MNKLEFNVKDFGALGNGNDDSVAFQNCIDACHDAQIKTKGVGLITVPQDNYCINNTVYMDWPDMQMVGGGAGAALQGSDGSSLLYLGMRRQKQSASDFPNANGVLDGSAGQRFGQNLKDASILFMSNAFQYGKYISNYTFDYYETLTQLTIEMMIVNPYGSTFGFGTWENAAPWVLTLGPNSAFCFNTNGSEPNATRFFNFPLTDNGNPIRLTVQVNLDTNQCSVFVNDINVPTSYSDWGSSKLYSPTKKFTPNTTVPFKIEGNGILFGFRMQEGIRYPNGISNTNDNNRYFKADNFLIGQLLFQDYMKQELIYQTQNAYGRVLRYKNSEKDFNGNLELKNLQLTGNGNAGQTLSIGNIFGVNLERLKIDGCTPIGSYPVNATYPLYMDRCVLSGSDTNCFLYFAILKATKTAFSGNGYDALRCVSCNSDWDTVFVSGVVSHDVFNFKTGGYGNTTKMDGVIIDYEGYTVKNSILTAENCNYVPGTMLTLRNFSVGSVGNNIPCINLRDIGAAGSSYGKAWIDVDTFTVQDHNAIIVQTDGPLWAGRINGYFLNNNKQLHNHIPKHGPKSNVVITNE